MEDYKILYYQLMGDLDKAIHTLIQIQQEAEERFLVQKDDDYEEKSISIDEK